MSQTAKFATVMSCLGNGVAVVPQQRSDPIEQGKFPLRIDPCLTSPRLVSAGGTGVIYMELLSVIRRWTFRDQLSIREISRRTGLSRNTIRKYLRSDVVEPAFKVPDRSSKLDAFAGKLPAWLKVEGSRPRKQKRTVKQLHADLVALGFQGSYGRVAAFAPASQNGSESSKQRVGVRSFR